MSKKNLDKLFDKFVEFLEDGMTNGFENPDGDRIAAGAGQLNVVRQFLKDNNITADQSHLKQMMPVTMSLPFTGDNEDDNGRYN